MVFDKFNYKFNVDYDEDDIKVIQYATALVSYRAALLVSIVTAVLLNRLPEKDITIAVDGSVYKHHPRLKRWMKQLIKELAPEKEVRLSKLTFLLDIKFIIFFSHLITLVPFNVGRRWQWKGSWSRFIHCSTYQRKT